jgi:hypothetical protein
MRCRGYIGARSWLTEANATNHSRRSSLLCRVCDTPGGDVVRRRFLCAP